ncbi:hypothetical protein BDV12DRAFT_201386 [Aspergillus spectabilis]
MLNTGEVIPVERSTAWNLTEHSTVLHKHEKRIFQVFGLLGVNLLTGLVAEALQKVLDALLESFTSDDIIWTNQENCRAHFTTQGGGNENFRTYAKDHGDPTAEEWKNVGWNNPESTAPPVHFLDGDPAICLYSVQYTATDRVAWSGIPNTVKCNMRGCATLKSQGRISACLYSGGEDCLGLCSSGVKDQFQSGGVCWGGDCAIPCLDDVPDDYIVLPNEEARFMVVGDSISHGMEDDWTWRYRLSQWMLCSAQWITSDAPPERRVTITFHVHEQGAWRKMDMVSVSPHHPTEAYIIADRYARDPNQNARFFDGRLRKVAVNECVRAAIDDGSFAVLMSFGKDLVVTRHLVASVAELFRAVGSEWQDPYHPEKRLKANTRAPSAGPVQTRKHPAPTETTMIIPRQTEQHDRRKLTPRIVARPPQEVRPNQVEAGSQPVTILFRIRDRYGRWKTAYEVLVDRSDPSQVERVARKEARNHPATFYDKNLRKLTPAQCFEGAIEDGTNMIFMNLEGELAINEDTPRSIAEDVEL